MLPSSVRRVVAAAPASPVVSTLASSVPRATATHALSFKRNGHQRRASSSKPSSPDNGPKDFSARPSVPSSSERAKTGEAKSTGEKRRRKAKDAAPAVKPLPSVPSTQHLSQEGKPSSRQHGCGVFLALLWTNRYFPQPLRSRLSSLSTDLSR